MKKLAALLAFAMLATASFGFLSISWESAGFFNEDGTAPATTGASEILWQLIYTPTGTASVKYDWTTESIDYGDDVVLSTRVWTSEGGDQMTVTDSTQEGYATETASKSPLQFVSDDEYGSYIDDMEFGYLNKTLEKSEGGLYSVIFRYTDEGIWSAQTAVVTDINWTKDNLPADGVHFDLENSTNIDTPFAIPEPATMSLLGLGALAMVIRRKLRK